jgi:hypothetical protein
MRRLMFACASAALFWATVSGTFVPLRSAVGVQYLFVWAGWPAILAGAGALSAILGLLYAGARVAARRGAPAARHAAIAGTWLTPLLGLGAIAGGLLPAVPHLGERAAPVAYLLYDLRWWWVGLAVSVALGRLDRTIGSPVGRRLGTITSGSPAARLLLLDAGLVVTVVTWVACATPGLRFSGNLDGDEPKYLRYCEVWYQGGGFDIGQKVLMSDAPIDLQPSFAALTAAPGIVLGEAWDLARDLRAFAAHPTTFRWNRGVKGENGFFTGVHGGLYELHQPGLSAVLFPGYLLDRALLGLESGYQGEVPADLVMTNAMMLAVYALAAVALFRLLRRALGSDRAAWAWAALAMMSLPTSAFAFQFYPELPAALLVLLATNVVWFQAATVRPVAASATGAAIGALAWLHPRFLLLMAVLGAAGLLRLRGRSRVGFALALALVGASLCAYNYRLTGSWSPTSAYALYADEVQFSPADIPITALAYFLDGTWGLTPHAPWLLALLPGLVWLTRRSPGQAAAVALPTIALVVTAASHSLTAAGGTPDRFVTAIVPLLVWPVAAVITWAWRSPLVRAVTAIGAVISLDTALAYNWTHEKGLGPLRDERVSGWKINLAFPVFRNPIWAESSRNLLLLLALVTILIGLSVLAWRRAGRAAPIGPSRRGRGLVPLVGAATVVVATLATTANETWTRGDYLQSPSGADTAAARALVARSPCRVCFSTAGRQIDWTALSFNDARGLRAETALAGPMATTRVVLDRAPPVPGQDGLAFGRVSVDYGDGTRATWSGIVGDETFSHRYAQPGRYAVTVSADLPNGRHATRETVHVDHIDTSRKDPS